MAGSSNRACTEWLRATLLSALGVVPLGSCTNGTSNSSTNTPAITPAPKPSSTNELTLTVPDRFDAPEPKVDEEEGSKTLRGYRFCNNHAALDDKPGWYECDTGLQHRAKAKSCPSELPRSALPTPPDPSSTCTADADCTEQANGYCASYFPFGSTLECQYGCTTDSDCGADELCFCGSPVGRCVSTECHVDAECEGRALCAIYELKTGEPINTFEISCQVPAHDQCGGSNDCGSGEICVNSANPGPYAGGFDEGLVSVGAHICISAELPEGRPFLIAGHARTAHAQQRDDWRAGAPSQEGDPNAVPPSDAALTPEQRRALHTTWLRRALLEHASIAAFSRFSLQLLQLGAPPELLAETQRATLDEIEHARRCFDLASRFGASAWGPGPLDIEGATLETSLSAIVTGTILEGCIGETLAALEASESARHARDVQVKATLEQIALDEARHAALAWRFVAWALSHADDQTRRWVAALFAAECASEVACDANGPLEASALTAYGVLPEQQRAALRAQGLRDVILPCATALLQRVALDFDVLGWGMTHNPSSVSASHSPVANSALPPRA